MEASTLSAKQVVDEVDGLTYRRLDTWIRRTGLQPVTAAKGSGSRRRFCERDVQVVRSMTKLVDLGVPIDQAYGIASTTAKAVVFSYGRRSQDGLGVSFKVEALVDEINLDDFDHLDSFSVVKLR